MNKLKILHLSSERSWRGGEQQIAYLIETLSQRNVENWVAVRAGSEFETHCINSAISFSSLPFRNSFDLATAWQLKKICQRHNISVVHAHSGKSHSLAVFSCVLGNRTPLIVSRRIDIIPKNNFLTRWKYNHRAVKKILCVSDEIKKIMKNFIQQPDKCITVYSGVDLHKFDSIANTNTLRREYNIADDYTLIGNTSAFDIYKDYFTFVDTIELLLQKKLKVKAFIIGRGPLEQAIREYVSNKNLEQAIIFTGFRKDVKNILGELSIFLMPSSMEGLGTSILDAFLAGVPVVSTIAGGIPEMVTHEKNGMLAPVGNSAMLAEHIERIMKDEALRMKLISGAREKVKLFSKELTAEKTQKIYLDVLKDQSDV